jgi:hypothetical protein
MSEGHKSETLDLATDSRRWSSRIDGQQLIDTASSEDVFGISIVLLCIRILLDLVATGTLVFGFYYRRYGEKELATSAAMFNVFIFAVLTVLSAVNFSVTAGFGLFAILALFTLRSEPLSKPDLTYFFGSITIAVICSVQGTSLPLVVLVLLVVLAGAWIIDHPRILRSVGGVKISLDHIDQALLADPVAMKQTLSQRLGVEVLSYQVLQMDYITEMARLNVNFRKR